MNKATTYTLNVEQDKAGVRLDLYLADVLPAMSRNRLQALIRDGQVQRDGKPVTSLSGKVREGEAYRLNVPEARPAVPQAQAIPINVIYEDADLIVIDKHQGLVVHPAPGHPDGTLVNALLAHCGDSLSGIGGVTRPGIVHRLDKDTSGLMVVAKNDAAHQHLARQLETRTLERRYKALVWGVPMPPKGTIEGAIGRNPANRKKMAVVSRGGKSAKTGYKVIKRVGRLASLVECKLSTGRTHQIRVHMTHLGYPVIGDPLYGGGVGRRLKDAPDDVKEYLKSLQYQALHAFFIAFNHPVNGDIFQFESELPMYFNELEGFLDNA
ncbi:MAG: RluA family pseudouridine synthase [Proteobacteria bacterium]|nr:RluA family pseudouridine synthase [Pseudomonadota bacterium]MDA1023794.1 RluA family pseudouridine synthase [Pseudomonadota bacterium]